MPGPDVPRGRLSKDQKNDLFEAVRSSGVPITEFELDEEAAPVTVIRHVVSRAAFSIRPFRGEGRVAAHAFMVDQRAGGEETGSARFGDLRGWGAVVQMARDWATQIRQAREREMALIEASINSERTPDLWEELRLGREFFGGEREEEYGNAPFDAAEQARISQQIQEIKAYIRTTPELTGEHIARVEARLDHAEEASRRMGRKDWLILFNGAVFSLILTDLITPDIAQHVVMMAIHGIGHLFGFGVPPPYLPPGG